MRSIKKNVKQSDCTGLTWDFKHDVVWVSWTNLNTIHVPLHDLKSLNCMDFWNKIYGFSSMALRSGSWQFSSWSWLSSSFSFVSMETLKSSNPWATLSDKFNTSPLGSSLIDVSVEFVQLSFPLSFPWCSCDADLSSIQPGLCSWWSILPG